MSILSRCLGSQASWHCALLFSHSPRSAHNSRKAHSPDASQPSSSIKGRRTIPAHRVLAGHVDHPLVGNRARPLVENTNTVLVTPVFASDDTSPGKVMESGRGDTDQPRKCRRAEFCGKFDLRHARSLEAALCHRKIDRDERSNGGHCRRDGGKPCSLPHPFGQGFGRSHAVPLLPSQPSSGVLAQVSIVPSASVIFAVEVFLDGQFTGVGAPLPNSLMREWRLDRLDFHTASILPSGIFAASEISGGSALPL
jgi:hypothetical protein